MEYSRITAFPEIGELHEKLKAKKAAILGVGAIGSNSALILAKMGVGTILVADRDIVEEENLPITAYSLGDCGKPKTYAIREIIKEANDEIQVEEIAEDITHNNIAKLKADIILDCTDNLETRFLLNEYCVKNSIPLVHAAALGSKAVLFVVGGGGCLSCIYQGKETMETCETAGILPAAALSAASMQANEALKIMLGKRHEGELTRLDVWSSSLEKIKVGIKKGCRAHKGIFEHLQGKGTKAARLCGSMFQIKGRRPDLAKIRLATKGKDFGYCISSEKITVFEDGRALVKARSEAEAKTIYARIVGK